MPAITEPNSTFSSQLRVILQYYNQKHPELLSAADRKLIDDIISRYGPLDLSQWTATDFSRWKQDGKLSSLSIFQNDDDGKISVSDNYSYHRGCVPQTRLTEDKIDRNKRIEEQLEVLVEAILSDPSHAQLEMSSPLDSLIQHRKAA